MGESVAPDHFSAFIGVGGGYNSVQFKQSLYGIGVANYSGAVTGAGTAQGPAGTFYDTVNSFSPEIQTGFQRHFVDSDHLWGVKFSYQYLGATATHQNFNVIQAGVVNGQTLSGNMIVESSQLKVNHEMLLLPFIGHSFKNTEIHFGVGPALFGTSSNVNGVIGFANVYGLPLDVSGAPTSGSTSEWIIGGAAEAGLSYYLSSDFRLDFNYTYAISKQYNLDHTSPFLNSIASGTITTSGTGTINRSQNLAAQALSVTINKVFLL